MLNRRIFLMAAGAILFFISAGSPAAEPKEPATFKELPKVGSAPAVLWREPTDIRTRDLYYGPGGKEHMPAGKLTFIEEKMNGVRPKFDARDEAGIKWGVKFGVESQVETAATRLVWAAGYFTQENYYLAELPARGLHMTRGENLIVDGNIQKVRLKRHNKDEHKIGNWSWDNNPFTGTKELDGLKVMMEVICNTDLKSTHRVIFDIGGTEQRYYLNDLGAAFSKAGVTMGRGRKLKDYQALPLIKNAGPEFIDFWYFKHIPRAHAKWIGGYLTQLSDEQIKDAFRAAGYSTEEVDAFAKTVRSKINELSNL